MGILKKMGGSNSCDSCLRQGRKETKEIGIQTSVAEPESLRVPVKMNESFDFL